MDSQLGVSCAEECSVRAALGGETQAWDCPTQSLDTLQERISGLHSTLDRLHRSESVAASSFSQNVEGGTHTDPAFAMQLVGERLARHFAELRDASIDDLLAKRYDKFRNLAQFYTLA